MTEMEDRICIIGAGASGMAAGIQLQKQLGIRNFVIYDENEDVGGTWLVNKYPGCACDVASHLYSYSFEPNPDWSMAYSSRPEIWKYFQKVAKKHDLYRFIQFSHKVRKVTWDETICKWRLIVEDTSNKTESEQIFSVIISGVGGLRVPNTPEEFLAFKGPRIHSAEWDESINLEGKTVGIIGSGASAVQIIPTIAKKVKKLIVYQRHPAWVMPRLQFKVPEWLKWSFTSIPGVREAFRAFIFWSNEINFPAFTQGNILQILASKLGHHFRHSQLKDRVDVIAKVKPNYEFGCKRVTPSNEYYPALALPHVEVIRNKITKVKDHSIVTEDGTENQIDILICATGFKVQDFFSPLEVRAKDGKDMLALWKAEGPKAYMGICSSMAPNWFMLLGPNTALGHNSVIFSIECQLNYIIQAIKEMRKREAKVMQVKESVEHNYMRQMMADMKPKVWSQDCAAWYANERGVVTALSPYSLVYYWMQTRKMASDDFIFY